jgi:UDP-N-acetylmuramyl-tripeptide synthetase
VYNGMRMKELLKKMPGYERLVLPIHWYRAFRAAGRYNYPAAGMKVIGVTGTNGKTTTCFMVHRLLVEAGYKVGLMTTVGWGVGKKIHPSVVHMTTESPEGLNRRIGEIGAAGAEFLVLEVSSHALSQVRTFGIDFDVVIETNVTHEHLDYHKTFGRYLEAKRKLFRLADRNRRGRRVGIINADDAAAGKFRRDIEHPITYGVERGEARARRVRLGGDGVDYDMEYGGRRIHIRTRIPGRFNVYNSLAAAVVGVVYGLSDRQIERGIWALERVDGRMNRVDEGQDFGVIVDFAHSPDAMENVYRSVGKVRGKIITVFGLPGRRDASNRALMGRIAGKYSDQIIVTEDDSRDEGAEKIAGEIVEGIVASGNGNYRVVIDRARAIREALEMAGGGDLVLLLGKGHERTIIRGDGEHGWSDFGVARRVLRGLKFFGR